MLSTTSLLPADWVDVEGVELVEKVTVAELTAVVGNVAEVESWGC